MNGFSEKDLYDEVQAIFDEMVLANKRIQVEWLANAVIARHPDASGADMDFYTLCAWKHLPVAVRAVVRRSKPDEEGRAERDLPLQPSLPGFTRLQTHYHVERDGEIELVPIDELSDADIDLKVQEYERMAEGCRLHAAELRRYKSYKGRGLD